jgi:hypothetical protein
MPKTRIDASLDAVTAIGTRYAPQIVIASPSMGDSARELLIGATKRFGTAGTGTPIRLLRGVAAESAAVARLGNGPLSKGGSGIKGGNTALQFAQAMPLIIVGAVIIGLSTRKVLNDVRAEEARVATETSNLASEAQTAAQSSPE